MVARQVAPVFCTRLKNQDTVTMFLILFYFLLNDGLQLYQGLPRYSVQPVRAQNGKTLKSLKLIHGNPAEYI